MRTLGGTIFAAVISLAALAGDGPSEPHLRGSVSESSRYESLHPWFAKAFAFMRRPDLGDLPCGRYEIDGTNCWAMVQEVSLKPFAKENQYEVHRAFIDIQAPIAGCETIGVVEPDSNVFADFDNEKDVVLFNAKGEPWTLKPGEFAVFFPERGAHAPGLSSDGSRKVRKLVIKVRASCCHNREGAYRSVKEELSLVGDGVTDDTAAIQALLDTGRSCVVLPPPKDHYVISKTLLIGSGQELRLDRFTRVRLAKGSDCFMLANRNRDVGDQRIALTGGIWDFDNVSQSPNPQQAHRCSPPVKVALPKSYDPDFFMGILMSFKSVDDLQIRHVTFRNPGSYCCQLAGVSNFRVDDVTFDFDKWNPIRLNMDGIHLDGDCHHGRITDLFGTCFDDLVAVNANDGFCSPKEAPITDIEIDGIHAEYCHSAVRILSAGAEIRRVSVRNVFGNFYTYAVGLTHFFPQKPRGTFEDIVIENVFAAKALAPEDIGVRSRVNFPLVWLQGPIDAGSVTIRNFARTEKTVPVATIRVDNEATVRRLTVRDCRMANELKEPIFFVENLGKVETLVCENNDFEGEWNGRDGKMVSPAAAANPLPKVNLAEYDWYEGSEFGLEGQAWPDMLAPYARIPRTEEPTLPPGPKWKGTWAVGLHVRFVTDSDEILVRSVARNPFSGKLGRVGRDGLDLYRRASRGEWRYHERRKWFEGVTNCFHAVWSPGEAGIVYLPQIGVVESFRIGVKKGSFLRQFPHESGVDKPVVHYGTSIVQGGEASRAGLMFTSVASRLADVPYANLGFSGNGWLEIEVARMLARAEASLYIVDCGWNTRIFDHATVKNRTLAFLRLLHEKHPETPILLCEAAHNGVEPRWEPCEIKMTLKDFNKPYREAYEELKMEIKNLHYLPQKGLLPEDGDGSDDFIHPNDYGMMRMGRVFADKISEILNGHAEISRQG